MKTTARKAKNIKNILFRRLLTAAFIACAFCPNADAQQFALKTNVLYDATATVNLGAEIKVAPKWSIDLAGNFNAWNLAGGRRWKHWLAQPEARYWLCDATAGHFFAIHALAGQYNFGHLPFARDFAGLDFGRLRSHRYQGWAFGAGIGYGYSWILSTHWGVEAEIAVGYIHASYDEFECEGCGRKTGNGQKGFFSPTKAALNLVYVF